MFGCPHHEFAVEKGNVEVPNLCTVETKHKTKWPPQGQAAECRHVPEWSPQEMQHGLYSTVLKDTGTCEPEEGELTILKSTTTESALTR